MPKRKGFLVGAAQMAGRPLPRAANPYAGKYELDALDEHVRATTARSLRLLERAGRMGLDLVLGGEDMQHVAHHIALPVRENLLRRYTHRIPGPLCEQIAAIAARHNMHVGACFFERAGARYYNTAVLFDRAGRLLGKYRKIHLPPQEACVLTPGRSMTVLATELGNIGFMICYDIMFRETARCLALHGADPLCHPTAGYGWTEEIGDVQARSRAIDSDAYVLIACSGRSQVIDPWGDVLADAGKAADVIVKARIDPRQHKTFLRGHFHRELTGVERIRDELLRERMPAAYRALTQSAPVLLSAARAPRRIYTKARKSFIRRLLAAEMKALAEGKKARCHWTARKPGRGRKAR